MAETTPQTYANHTRFVLPFHFVVLPLLLLNFLWAAYRLVTGFSFDAAVTVLLAVALLFVALLARIFASDGEVPNLVQRVLDGELTDQRAIKQAITTWRADYDRV